jgi:hypothetical protein
MSQEGAGTCNEQRWPGRGRLSGPCEVLLVRGRGGGGRDALGSEPTLCRRTIGGCYFCADTLDPINSPERYSVSLPVADSLAEQPFERGEEQMPRIPPSA